MILRDSVTASGIPLGDLAAVAGYGDGIFQWSSADWARFPAPIVPLSIVVSPWHQGDILDVERGDATPADCPGWVDRFSRPGRRRPTLYHSRDARGAVLAAMAGRAYDWWAATLDGTQQVAGAVAVQYRNFGGYDESIITDPSWVGGDMADLVLSADDQRNLLNCMTYVKDEIAAGGDPADPQGTSYFASHMKTLDAIAAKVNSLETPLVDATALAQALAADQAFVTAIAAAVVKLEGAKLST